METQVLDKIEHQAKNGYRASQFVNTAVHIHGQIHVEIN